MYIPYNIIYLPNTERKELTPLFCLFNIFRSIVEKLGHERTSKIKIVGKDEVEQSFYGQLVLGKGISSSLDEQLVKEAKKAGGLSI